MNGPRPALALIDEIAGAGDLNRYHLLHSARADLLRRLGSSAEAEQTYATAIGLVTNDVDRRFPSDGCAKFSGRTMADRRAQTS